MEAIRDGNHVPVALGVSTLNDSVTVPMKVDPDTGELQVALASSPVPTPVADGTYTVGLGTPVTGHNGTITVESGVITAIQQAD